MGILVMVIQGCLLGQALEPLFKVNPGFAYAMIVINPGLTVAYMFIKLRKTKGN